jgi:hypothetical protein
MCLEEGMLCEGLVLVVGYRAGYAASDGPDGRAFSGIAIARVVADGCARCAADSRTRQRSAGTECKEGSNDSCSDNSFHVRHDFVSSIIPGDNALKLGPFRFETSMNQVRSHGSTLGSTFATFAAAAGAAETVPAVQRERSFLEAPGALNELQGRLTQAS